MNYAAVLFTALAGVGLCACNPEPRLLSDTGLYADINARTLAEGVRVYQPQFPL